MVIVVPPISVTSSGPPKATSKSPGHDASLVPGPVPPFADQRTAAVSLAGVNPLHSPGTHEAGVQLEERPQSSVLSQVFLAALVGDDGNHHLLQYLLIP